MTSFPQGGGPWSLVVAWYDPRGYDRECCLFYVILHVSTWFELTTHARTYREIKIILKIRDALTDFRKLFTELGLKGLEEREKSFTLTNTTTTTTTTTKAGSHAEQL